jgi:hypothetical protein
MVDNHESGWHRMGFESPALRATPYWVGGAESNGWTLISSALVISHLRSSQSLRLTRPALPAGLVVSEPGGRADVAVSAASAQGVFANTRAGERHRLRRPSKSLWRSLTKQEPSRQRDGRSENRCGEPEQNPESPRRWGTCDERHEVGDTEVAERQVGKQCASGVLRPDLAARDQQHESDT